MTLTNQERAAKRAEANQLQPMLHVGKNGITDAAVDELKRHLKKHKLVKVRLLPSASDGGAGDAELAAQLAEATESELIERRGHTAVFWRR